MSQDEDRPSEEPAPEAPGDGSLADTQADLHEEGKALSDDNKDLGEKLAEIFERRENDG